MSKTLLACLALLALTSLPGCVAYPAYGPGYHAPRPYYGGHYHRPRPHDGRGWGHRY